MTITVATLDGDNLPLGFSYRPYIPEKRLNTLRTANAVVVQAAAPSQIVHGEGLLSWVIRGAYPYEFQDLYDLYATTNLELYTFTGYWGEVLEVYFNILDTPTVRGRIFDVTGSFQVMCVTTPMDAKC